MAINEAKNIDLSLVTDEIEEFTNDVNINPSNSTLGLSAYLTLESLLNGNQFSWADALELSCTRTTNVISELRKAIEFEDIETVKIPTKYSYYEKYKANNNPESVARLKKLFNHVANKSLVQKRLERINPEWLKLQ